MQWLEWLREYPHFRYALVTGIAVATLCSLLSVMVVLKRMAFIGQGISHAGFGGVGTAVFLGTFGLTQDLVVMLFCVVTAIVIGAMTRRREIETDSAIGILLVAAMAWGVLANDLAMELWNAQVQWYVDLVGGDVDRRTSYERLLFGSLLMITKERMIVAVVTAVVVLLICSALFKEILFYSFDQKVSQVYGVPAGFVHYLMLIILAITIVVSIRLAGFVLVSALLVIPGATALQMSRRLAPVFVLSWLVGTVGVVGGLILSLQLGEVSTGVCIVGVLCTFFFTVFLGRIVLLRLSRRSDSRAAG